MLYLLQIQLKLTGWIFFSGVWHDWFYTRYHFKQANLQYNQSSISCDLTGWCCSPFLNLSWLHWSIFFYHILIHSQLVGCIYLLKLVLCGGDVTWRYLFIQNPHNVQKNDPLGFKFEFSFPLISCSLVTTCDALWYRTFLDLFFKLKMLKNTIWWLPNQAIFWGPLTDHFRRKY